MTKTFKAPTTRATSKDTKTNLPMSEINRLAEAIKLIQDNGNRRATAVELAETLYDHEVLGPRGEPREYWNNRSVHAVIARIRKALDDDVPLSQPGRPSGVFYIPRERLRQIRPQLRRLRRPKLPVYG